MSKASDGDQVNCPNPIDAGVLADYWLAVLAEPEEAAAEEHLLACDECGGRLREVIALAEGVSRLAREGSLQMVVSDAYLQCAAEQGLHIRQYAPPPGGSVECTVTAEDDILISRLAAKFSEAERVDVCLCDERGNEQTRMKDIPVNPAADSVLLQVSMNFAKAAPTMKLIVRLVGTNEKGAERLLGEYTFNHTRSLPGPGAW